MNWHRVNVKDTIPFYMSDEQFNGYIKQLLLEQQTMTAHGNTMQFLKYLKEYSKVAKPVLFEGKITGNKETRKIIEFNYKSPFDAVITIIHHLKNSEEVCGNAYYNGYMSRPNDNVCFFSIGINTNNSHIYIDCEMRKDKLTIFI